MESRISTRRCIKGQIPCQEIQNLFAQYNNPQFNMMPDDVWKSLPTTQKVSCEIIEKMKEFRPRFSSEQTLKELRDSARVQFEEIQKMIEDGHQPDNAQPVAQQSVIIEKEVKIKKYESPIRKMVKKEHTTKQISDYGSEDIKPDKIFVDDLVIEQLEDYLCID